MKKIIQTQSLIQEIKIKDPKLYQVLLALLEHKRADEVQFNVKSDFFVGAVKTGPEKTITVQEAIDQLATALSKLQA